MALPHGTTGSLRPGFLFRRRPPQSNYPPDSVLDPDHGPELVSRDTQGGISRMAPPKLASRFQRLPPILHKVAQNTLSSCSKGPGGLSVFPRVDGIFTATSISPRPSLRHRRNRYAIRAGRNLPDKEFRYIRTVIVTAAVYQGFGSELLRANPNDPSP